MYGQVERRFAPSQLVIQGASSAADVDMAFMLTDTDAAIKAVKDDLGRFGGHGSTSNDWSNGGAGATPMDPGACADHLKMAGIHATHTAHAVGGGSPAHLTPQPHADVHQRLLDAGYSHVASNAAAATKTTKGSHFGGSDTETADDAGGPGGPDDTDDVAVNVYDKTHKGRYIPQKSEPKNNLPGTQIDAPSGTADKGKGSGSDAKSDSGPSKMRFVTHHTTKNGGRAGTAIRGYHVGMSPETNEPSEGTAAEEAGDAAGKSAYLKWLEGEGKEVLK